jgi:hypothetical protein
MGSRSFRTLVAGAAAVVTLGATQGVAAAHRWTQETAAVPPGPNPFTVLRGVSCPSSSSCTAVGGFFTSADRRFVTLVERWDGAGWTIQPSPNPDGASNSELEAVSCPSATSCMAVGFTEFPDVSGNMPLAERWDGSSWTLLSVPLPVGVSAGWLEGVSCAAASDCTAVGRYDDATGSTNAFAEHWDGSSWTVQNAINPPGAAELHGVACSSAGACTAVGYVGGASTGGASATLAERWDGSAWTLQSTPNPVGLYNTELSAASCPSATACTAVGYYTSGFSTVGTPLAEQWDGSTWNIKPTPNLPHAGALRGVSCVSASDCAAVGTDYGVIGERWDGSSWKLQHLVDPVGATYSELTGVSCAAAGECMAVGYYYGDSYDQPLIERYS